MAFKANVLLIISLVLIISSEIIAREMVEPSLPLLESNEVVNTNGMKNPTLQKQGGGKGGGKGKGKGGFFFDLFCKSCECPKDNNNGDGDNDNNDDNNNDNNNNNNNGGGGGVCQTMCC
uniref:HT protein n=1 Tax=Petunia integrifolia subsp. inflata TaxID=212142 RepID=C0SPG2_PETIN|nr:HT protein [Petunia integrifolia subsp. inflata]BAH56517.1 PiHT-B [Petunia integrifolia subsp. inflata]